MRIVDKNPNKKIVYQCSIQRNNGETNSDNRSSKSSRPEIDRSPDLKLQLTANSNREASSTYLERGLHLPPVRAYRNSEALAKRELVK